MALIRNLPADSSTAASLQGGDQFRGWDSELYMLANLIDAVNQNTYTLVAANSKRKPSPPKPFHRPKANKTKKKATLFSAMAQTAYLTAQKQARKADTNDESGR